MPPMALQMEPYIPASAIAEALNCSLQHVHNLIDRGRLAAIDIGVGGRPNFRISESAFLAFLAASAIAPSHKVS